MSTAPARTETVDITSGDGVCRATWFGPAADGPVPAVVLAHGLGGTADSGLRPFAESFAAAGVGALTLDYRGFGGSPGGARQIVSVSGQQEDYRSALGHLESRSDVDADRLVLWGVSLSAGHVLEIAADDDRVAAVIAVSPLVDGGAAAVAAARELGAAAMVASTGRTFGAVARRVVGRAVPMMPLVGPPGSGAALSSPGYEEAYRAVAGPSWRNEVGADVGMVLGSFRPARRCREVRVPTLVQIGDLDRAAPPHAAVKAARAARAEVRHYPADHFDLLPGGSCAERALEHQLHFLRRHLL